MFILEKPYVSELMLEAIVKNDFPVLKNQSVEDTEIEEGALNLIDDNNAKNYYLQQEHPTIIGNSENSALWVLSKLFDTNISNSVKLLKDKNEFRCTLKEMYPEFNYQLIEYSEIKNLKPTELKFPLVIKPNKGVWGFGVHIIKDTKEWKDVLQEIEKELKQTPTIYPKQIFDASKFIIEDYIEGEEFAIDAYFDRNGEPIILNIFQHPFLNSKDIRNRIYLASTGIMIKYMAKFGLLLREIGTLMNLKNFPIHAEFRITKDDKIIPIEINPMRFSSWCAADIAKYAWGVNVYEMFYKQEHPDWNTILTEAGRGVFYFAIAEVPNDINKKKITGFEYKRFLENFSNVLEVRRIDPAQNPVAIIVFGSTFNKNEVLKVLSLKTNDYLITN